MPTTELQTPFQERLPLTVAIPTYNREAVLVATIRDLLALHAAPAEVLVLDQTDKHEPSTEASLSRWHAEGAIRWLRLPEPSIPKAMNQGLALASHDVVVFVDDDVRPEPELLTAHAQLHATADQLLVAGRVIQPWQESWTRFDVGPFHFARTQGQPVEEFIGCNFSVRRSAALQLGGFDENFVRVAYRFEAEFAHRFVRAGGRIWFEPRACLHHLKDAAGGTRTFGDHLRTWRPDHAVGAYYHAMRTGTWRAVALRPLRAACTRYHLHHPWQIPGTVLAELRGLAWALKLHRSGPRYVSLAAVQAPQP